MSHGVYWIPIRDFLVVCGLYVFSIPKANLVLDSRERKSHRSRYSAMKRPAGLVCRQKPGLMALTVRLIMLITLFAYWSVRISTSIAIINWHDLTRIYNGVTQSSLMIPRHLVWQWNSVTFARFVSVFIPPNKRPRLSCRLFYTLANTFLSRADISNSRPSSIFFSGPTQDTVLNYNDV
jgi:hypothetical protein